MKNIQTTVFAALLCMAALLTSCIHNNSVYGGLAISQIKFSDSLKTDFTADKFDTFTMEAPRFTQGNADKPVQYEWEIDYKKVGNEKVLKYVCENLGNFQCRLKISNEDGAVFYGFNLLVKSPYHQGLMVMSSFNDKAMFSFKREDIVDKPFYKHVYANSNPSIPLGNTPVSVLYHGKFLYFATNNPARMLKVDGKTMETLLVVDYEGKSIGELNAAFGDNSLTVTGNGLCSSYETKQDMFMGYEMKSILGVVPNAKLSNSMVFANDNSYLNYPYFFDDASGSMLTIIQYKAKKIEYEQLKDMKLIKMMLCNEKKEILMLLQETATSDIYLAHYIHETYTLRSMKKIPLEKGKTISACVASRQYPFFYYSIGNKVYVHNYLSENFSDKPLYTLGSDGDTVGAMLFSPEQDRLYIGLNRTGWGEYNGDVFCFNAEKNTLLWSEKGVAGEIAFMGYKDAE